METTITDAQLDEWFESFLSEAEDRYGPRDLSYSWAGISLTDGDIRVHYPTTRSIGIRIDKECRSNAAQAVYQLSHETIHCIAPSGGEKANFLEEGLAVYFSMRMVEKHNQDIRPKKCKYKYACALVEPILIDDPNFIKKLRAINQALYLATPELIVEINSKISIRYSKELCKRFANFDDNYYDKDMVEEAHLCFSNTI